MEREQQVLAFAVLLPVPTDTVGERGNVARFIMVLVDETRLRNPPQRMQLAATLSNTEAVVVPEYCGYSGNTRSRRALAACSLSIAAAIDGSP